MCPQDMHFNLDDYGDDVGHEEREFMKLWNTHVRAFPPYSDALLPAVCERFVTRFADVIVANELRYMALLHFLTMWDFGLLRKVEVARYMGLIDRVQHATLQEADTSRRDGSSSHGGGGEGGGNASISNPNTF